MLSDSWNVPWLTAPSTKKQITASDDGVSAHEAPLTVEHVHRAAHSAAYAVDAAEQLGHDIASRRSAHQSMCMLAIGADDVIGRPGRVDDARADRLLAWIEMEEADDIALAILFRGPLLEGSRQQHVTKQTVQCISFHGAGSLLETC